MPETGSPSWWRGDHRTPGGTRPGEGECGDEAREEAAGLEQLPRACQSRAALLWSSPMERQGRAEEQGEVKWSHMVSKARLKQQPQPPPCLLGCCRLSSRLGGDRLCLFQKASREKNTLKPWKPQITWRQPYSPRGPRR